MGSKGKVRTAAEQKLQLPQGCLQRLARLEICERRRAVVEGCGGLLCCEEGEMTLRTAQGAVRLRGGGLQLESLGANEAVIVGEILSVEFV